VEVDFETVNPSEEEEFLEIETENAKFKMKLRPRSPPQAYLFQNLNKKMFCPTFIVDWRISEPFETPRIAQARP
jgi:hypothetical protein